MPSIEKMSARDPRAILRQARMLHELRFKRMQLRLLDAREHTAAGREVSAVEALIDVRRELAELDEQSGILQRLERGV